MRSLLTVGLVLAFSLTAFAQHRGMGMGGGMRSGGGMGMRPSGGMHPAWGGGHRGAPHAVQPQSLFLVPTIPFRTFGSPSGFGSVVFPGVGTAPPITPFSTSPFSFPATFIDRFGATISGFPGFTGTPFGTGFGFGGFGFGAGFGPGFGGFGGYPVAYPVAVPESDEYGNEYAQQPYPAGAYPMGYPQQQAPPNITIVMPPQAALMAQPQPQPQPEAGIQSYQAPTMQRPSPPEEQQLFFIALNDSSVYTAVAYWVQDGTLHFVTPQGEQRHVALASVDRQISARLNRGNLQLQLPPQS